MLRFSQSNLFVVVIVVVVPILRSHGRSSRYNEPAMQKYEDIDDDVTGKRSYF
uniref:Uncharacterized protein n=1 Tax=Ciona intestinalis TaxID=7719 RepID=F6WNK7_CIOIN